MVPGGIIKKGNSNVIFHKKFGSIFFHSMLIYIQSIGIHFRSPFPTFLNCTKSAVTAIDELNIWRVVVVLLSKVEF